MIFRRLRLLQHLDALRHVFFFYAGDTLSTFMNCLFNDDAESTLKDNSLSFVNLQLESASKTTLPGDSVISDFQKIFGFTQ